MMSAHWQYVYGGQPEQQLGKLLEGKRLAICLKWLYR